MRSLRMRDVGYEVSSGEFHSVDPGDVLNRAYSLLTHQGYSSPQLEYNGKHILSLFIVAVGAIESSPRKVASSLFTTVLLRVVYKCENNILGMGKDGTGKKLSSICLNLGGGL